VLEHVVAIVSWLEQLPLAVAIARSNWIFPALETIHVIALTLTIGTVLIVDLRLLMLASQKQSYQAVRQDVLPLTWIAFCMAAVSGFLMFLSQASEYFVNQAFRIKFVLLLLIGFNMLVFELTINRNASVWGGTIPWPGKLAALLSIVLWIAVVFFGRRIGFTMLPDY
jgi:hypothetical protein